MVTVYLNAIHDGGANVRGGATTSARVVRTLSGYGELAKSTVSKALPDGYWSEYIFTDGKLGWVREDVHEAVVLKPSVRLDVPYRSQTASDAAKFQNDCAYACLAMLMDFTGHNAYSVDDIAVKGGMSADVPQSFGAAIRAAKAYGFESEARQGTHLTDILISLNSGQPMMALVNYEHLRLSSKYRYGHFVVPTGYELSSDGLNLTIVVHDPYWQADMRYSAAQFARAIGDMAGTGNGGWQSLFVTNWSDFITPEPPPPSGDNSPVIVRLQAIHRQIATLNAEASELLRTIEG